MTEYFCKFVGLTRPEAGKGSPAGNPYAVGVKVPHATQPPYTSPARHTTPDNHNPRPQRCRGLPQASPSLAPPEGHSILHPATYDIHEPSAPSHNPRLQRCRGLPQASPSLAPRGSFHPAPYNLCHPRPIRTQPQPRLQRCRGLPQASPSLAARRASFPHGPLTAAKKPPRAHCAGWLFCFMVLLQSGCGNPSGETVTLFSEQPLPGVPAGILLPVWLPP